MEKQKSNFILTFEWHSLLRDLKRNLWIIVLAALIAFMGVYIAERSIYTPTYTSSATLVVRAKVGTSGAYTNLSVSSEMATIFTKVFVQPSIKQLAAENIGLGQFAGSITASTQTGTNLLNLSVTASDPELSFQLLKSVLEVYPNVSSSVFSNAVIDVMIAPQMPTAPSNIISFAHRGVAILFAMLLQTCLIILISLLRDTVKDEKSFVDKIDAKLLGTITHEKVHLTLKERLLRKKRALLINDAFSSLKFSEDYQKIVTKLEWMNKNNKSKIFLITSVSENEGKSTSAANLAIGLAGRGHRVLLVDLDIRKPSIYKIFDYRTTPYIDFPRVISMFATGGPEFYETLRHRKSNLYLAMNKKSYKPNNSWFNLAEFRNGIKAAAQNMDFVIIDTAPFNVSVDAINLYGIADKTILVARTDHVPAENINDIIMTISNVKGDLAGCILNDVYKPFTLFHQIGLDAGGYYHYKHGSYKGYGGYGKHLLSESSDDVKNEPSQAP